MGSSARPSSSTLAVGLLGLGEAGSAIAAGLREAGVRVRAWDPVAGAADGIELVGAAEDVTGGSAAVLSVNSAQAALEAARAVAPALEPGQLFADLNTASPRRKRDVAKAIEPTGAAFADVALLSPVPGRGLRTPAIVSGPGARRFVELFGPLGMPVEEIGEEVGAAAARKLVRSVFMKGLAAALAESLAAAEAAGCGEWLVAEAARTLEEADGALVERLIEGSRAHAVRRAHEMEEATALLRELRIEPRIAAAAERWLSGLAAEERARAREALGVS